MSPFGSLAAVLNRKHKQSAGAAATAEHPARRFNTEDISIQLQRVLTPMQIESLSLHNALGELVWRNDGAFGDDEAAMVLDALDMFALDEAREDLRLKLDDDRSALFACARDAGKVTRGVALLIVETPEPELTARLDGPRLQTQLRRFAQLLAPPPAATAATPDAPAPPGAPEEVTPAAETPAAEAPAALVAPPLRTERRAARSADLAAGAHHGSIRARRYTRLRAGGAARRYEVKASSDATFKGDLALTTLVAGHVKRSLERYTQTPSTFAVPLSIKSVTQGGWLSKINTMLKRIGLPRGMLGFSLPAAAWRAEAQAAERFIAECEAVGCFIALDDFSLRHAGFALLRSGAVKCLKLDARLIAAVDNDRFAHAQLAAIVQAARVLGLYCVAKQVTSTAQAKWLTSAGIEFADGVGRGVIIAAAPRRETTDRRETTEM